MNKYDVTLQGGVNVRVSAMEAATPQQAIEAAMDSIDLYGLFEHHQPASNVESTEYAEEVHEALVDEIGVEYLDSSQWFIRHNGHWVPRPTDRNEELRLLDQQAEVLREDMGYSQGGEVIWLARLDFDDLLAVVADGYGRASVLRVSGNYPVEYDLKDRKDFASEEAACAEAARRANASQRRRRRK